MLKFYHLLATILICLSVNAQNLLPSAFNLIPDNYGVTGMSVPDANTVWATCAFLDATSPVASIDTVHVLRSVDGGTTWQVKQISNFPGYYPLDIFALNNDTAFVSLNTFGFGSQIVKTYDGGDTWTISNFGMSAAGIWVKFFNDMDGVIINTGNVAITTDAGNSWQMIPSGNIPAFLPGEYNSVTSGNNSCVVRGNSIWFGTSQGRIFRSTDKGNNWSVSNTTFAPNTIVQSVAFKDSLNGIAVGIGSVASLNITTDGGQNWTSQTLAPAIPIDNVEFVEGTDSTLVATCDWVRSFNNRRAAYSKDFGKTWTVFNSFIPFGGAEFISPTIGFLGSAEYATPVAHDTVIYKWNSNILVGVDELYPKLDLTIYPNPFSNYINLDFDNTLIKIEKVEVLNTSGKLCDLIIPKSPNYYQLDLAELRPGIYQIVLHTNKGRVTKRLIKTQ